MGVEQEAKQRLEQAQVVMPGALETGQYRGTAVQSQALISPLIARVLALQEIVLQLAAEVDELKSSA